MSKHDAQIVPPVVWSKRKLIRYIIWTPISYIIHLPIIVYIMICVGFFYFYDWIIENENHAPFFDLEEERSLKLVFLPWYYERFWLDRKQEITIEKPMEALGTNIIVALVVWIISFVVWLLIRWVFY